MTYCLAFLLDAGLVFASDSRTNAGVDYISTYSKMHIFKPAPDRIFVIMAAGNLGTTQAVLNRIRRDIDEHQLRAQDSRRLGFPLDEEAADEEGPPDFIGARYLFEVADYIGTLSVSVQRNYRHSLREAGATGEASFILGGQIAGQPHGLYLIYPQGNAIMASQETPFLQIGESKYGKPPLDYIGHHGMSLEDAARLCLVSQVVTRRSNLTVGPPFDVAMLPRDALEVSRRLRLQKDSFLITRTMETWARSMQDTLSRLPRFSWEEDPL
ncbi:MAG: 20S proteasome subunit A/B [Cyanobacteriota bacterium]|jgi:putative proteasome-type protease